MKKIIVSLGYIAISAAFVLFQRVGTSSSNYNASATLSQPLSQPANSGSPSETAIIAPASEKVVPTAVATVPPRLGPYRDGTYTGNQADAFYGIIQVRATIANGALADIRFLRYPNDRSTSRSINSQAMPILKSEAIRMQNANVDIVSGATDTSMAFQESLAKALAKAKS